MFKKEFFIFILLCPMVLFCQSSSNNNLVSRYKNFSAQQLYDTGGYYDNPSSADTALVCYRLFISTPVKDDNAEHQKQIIEAHNRIAVLYYNMCDYRSAYEFLIEALLLCEKTNDLFFEPRICTNIGNIYYRFNKYDIAKRYYARALNLCLDTTSIVVILNNLGATELESGNMDSAFYFLNKSLQMSKMYNDVNLYNIQNNLASLYQKKKQYDLAFHYFRLSLEEANENNEIEMEANNLSDLGKLFFEVNKIDSALFYINLSNHIAKKNDFLGLLATNFLTLSKIEEAKGRTKNAFEYYKTYANLRDSIFNVANFGDINQLQRLYEVTKTNQQIEQLAVERQIKERTIYYQRIIQLITWVVLLLVTVVLLVIIFQKRKLDTAYKVLFEKNMKIIDLQENSSDNSPEKYKKSALTNDLQDELLDRILIVMEDTPTICDTKFTIDKLAELVQSNQTYVSQAINTTLKKNFRSFLNNYRIQEAQHIFSAPNATKYTIESVALQVGFKSPNAFRHAFQEITGVSPNFYLKSMQKQNR